MLVRVLVRVLACGQAVNQVSVKGAMKKPAGGAAAKKGAAASAGDAAPPEQVEVSWDGQLTRAIGSVMAESVHCQGMPPLFLPQVTWVERDGPSGRRSMYLASLHYVLRRIMCYWVKNLTQEML